MNHKLFLLGLLFIILALNGQAQHYHSKPHLVLQDTVSKNTFSIKRGATIFLKTTKDSIATEDYILRIRKDMIKTIYHGNIHASDIEEIAFRPAKAKHTIKTIIYSTGLACEIIVLSKMGRTTEPNGVTSYMAVGLVLIPVTILTATLVGEIVHIATPKITLYKKDCIIYTVPGKK